MLVALGATSFTPGRAPASPANGRSAVGVSMKWGELLGEGETTATRDLSIDRGRGWALTKDHGPLIITLATTGNINTRENNPTLPCSPREMADQMHECIKLGVSVLHIHARNELLKPTMRVDKFRETVRLIKERDPDVVIQISTGGRAPPVQFEGVDVGEWRMDPLNLMPEMASYTPGSVNLGPIVYQNDAKLVKDMAQRFTETGIKPQVECFDTNMISNANQLVKQGLLQRPLDFGLVMGAPGAQECSLRQLGHLISMMEPGDTWTSIGIGKFEMPLAYMAIAMGGHVRVGLEDNNKTPDGEIASNYDLVKHVVDVAKAMGREIATPEQARQILSMPAENADWILDKLDPSVPLESLVSNMSPYQALEPIPGSLEMRPTAAHPDSPDGKELSPYSDPAAAAA